VTNLVPRKAAILDCAIDGLDASEAETLAVSLIDVGDDNGLPLFLGNWRAGRPVRGSVTGETPFA
jgi:hypothetical protein